MFGELTREATGLAERTNVLQARIDRLAIKVTQLDSGVEEGKFIKLLYDVNLLCKTLYRTNIDGIINIVIFSSNLNVLVNEYNITKGPVYEYTINYFIKIC